MDIPRYEFAPLNTPDEIRVLKLRPTRARLEVHIHHVSVSECNFEALSYVWGKPDQANYAIVCDESNKEIGWIPLTMNLGNAMSDLRDAEELKSKVFWIDQICINQADETEKGHQVAMMRQIYTQSKRVITYLGPAGLEAEEIRGIKLLNNIYESILDRAWGQIHEAGSLEQIRDFILDGNIEFRQLPRDLELEAGKLYDDDEISKRYAEQGWEWVLGVAYSELTQRLWIVQEQLLNEEIIMLRGPRLIDWDTILTIPILFAVGHLPQQYHDIGRRNMGEISLSWDKVEEILYVIWWDRHARQEHGDEYSWSSLFHNLQWYQPLLCADARDRFYAILAISRDAKVLDLMPDYSLLNTVGLLSKQLSIRVLEKAINLELLVYAISWRSPNSTLPSWCLTLDQPVRLDTPEPLPFEVYTPHPRPYRYFPAHFHTDNSVLAVRGQILDYVSISGSEIIRFLSVTEDQSIPSHFKFLCSIEYLLRDGFSIEDVVSLLRTITAKGPWSVPPDLKTSSDETMVFHFWVYLRYQLRSLSDSFKNSAMITSLLKRFNLILTEIQQLFSNFDKNDPRQLTSMTDIEHIAYDRISRHALEQGRYVGRTRSGRFFNAMNTVHKDDSIVALQGADRLFVIRRSASAYPDGNAYKLVGDIFVDGLMDEEAYENQDPDIVDYEIELE
ncbi:hypothetical protein N7540_011709 [Penicillium herquei]|nr:hypothetical protein N7540_011709 [Penicillium herquei]